MQSKRKTIHKEPYFISLLTAITSEFVGRLHSSISQRSTQKSDSLSSNLWSWWNRYSTLKSSPRAAVTVPKWVLGAQTSRTYWPTTVFKIASPLSV